MQCNNYMHCIVDDDLLSINNIKEVLDEMWDYRARWKSIGIELCVDTGTLDEIEKDYRKVNDCLQEMIKHWLRNSPRPTRENIKVALQSKPVSGNLLCKQAIIMSSISNYNKYMCLLTLWHARGSELPLMVTSHADVIIIIHTSKMTFLPV